MTNFIVITRDGNESELDVSDGLSVMEAIRDSGIDELLALCGGCCSCATCHVYTEIPDGSLLPPLAADENDLLDGSSHRKANSRLSCQIPVSSSIAGSRFTIAPED
jgi:2Fe-2S ferredoxin